MKKGFTLIELLAVIIILAIIALIATPIILDVIDDAKKSAAKSEAAMIVSGVNSYCAAAKMQEQITSEPSICEDGVTDVEVEQMVDLGNAKINEITYENGKVTKLVVESNGKVVTYSDGIFSIDGDAVILSASDYAKIYAITNEGTITGFKTADEVGFMDFIIPTVHASELTQEAQDYLAKGKITIPEYVGTIEVKAIAANAFKEYAITEITIVSEKVITIASTALPETITKVRVKACTVDGYSSLSNVVSYAQCGTSNPIVPEPEIAKIICKKDGNPEEYTHELVPGTVFYCDVNGDEVYDKKFHYVTELEENTDYGVLLYATILGNSPYSTGNPASGPDAAINLLPTTEEWPNISLYNPIRPIKFQNGTTGSILGVELNDAFSYEGRAARLLTLQEATSTLTSMGIQWKYPNTINSSYSSFLFSGLNNSYTTNLAWLENAHSSVGGSNSFGQAATIRSKANTTPYYDVGFYRNASDSCRVKAAIEVKKTSLEY